MHEEYTPATDLYELEQLPGSEYPLGATWDGAGVNFSIYAQNASIVWLCLFDTADPDTEQIRVPLKKFTHGVWHGYFPGLRPGQLYGFRAEGPYQPELGERYNVNKLLLDPYAKSTYGDLRWDEALFGYQMGHEEADLTFSDKDSAAFMPKSVVVDPSFDWRDDHLPRIPPERSVIYEAHVKGLTMLHPDIPEELRGTYAAIGHPVMIAYLKELGITTIELLPVHTFVSDHHLHEKGLSNYWGYNTIGFFAPERRYAAGKEPGTEVAEFKEMVRSLHEAGIEVILDVVYNHTGEGNQMGPTLCFRGIDNAEYYRLEPDLPRYYRDYTGTGNTLNTRLPNVLRLIMDSLRYWISEMHVDGFRFDLASTLARELHDVNRLSAFFDIIHQDPLISQVKLIAEPWDVGEGGYQVGKFPPGWSEWNGMFRDLWRRFWRGDEGTLAEMSCRFLGSPDLYQADSRLPTASINFITAHDGFSLYDLVSYNEKHNEANGEDNQDGESENLSWNCGEEGETTEEAVLNLRRRQQRNFLCGLLLSQGVPMMTAGAECGKTQHGNNNVYCQDNEISWLSWTARDHDLFAFTKALLAFRRDNPLLRQDTWVMGDRAPGSPVKKIAWFSPAGSEMKTKDWHEHGRKTLCIFLSPTSLDQPAGSSELFLIFNASHEAVQITFPKRPYRRNWTLAFASLTPEEQAGLAFQEEFSCPPHSVLVFRPGA
ncbi:glycogen debranching protein GlgX [Pedobacter sp. SYP-B3415]|uniref:glycogen debranching protein GlgX n=1 Tax=Pedobacter sp. SYP-B3415 TaxID=2496641 RepID=UPI00101B61F7|nr:glycogen debranching protein GlgX [Pedobacter sp. SYP-B3415]